MDNNMKNSLDNWITGHYGSDELTEDNEPDPILQTVFALGVTARAAGDSIDTCSYTEPHFRNAWRFGWMDEDSSRHEYETGTDSE